jgi:hypothetical protein
MIRGVYRLLMSAMASFGILLLLTPVHAEEAFHVEKVVIAKNVTNRNPEGIFSPDAYCEKDKNGQAAIPVVETAQTSKVIIWMKIAATTSGRLRHSWHHQIEGIWTKVSEVNLSIHPSLGYRTWSFKSLKSEIHRGEWMVVVAPSKTPEEILCITRFTVQ